MKKFRINWELLLTAAFGWSAWKTWAYLSTTEFVGEPDLITALGTFVVVAWAVASTVVFGASVFELLFLSQEKEDKKSDSEPRGIDYWTRQNKAG